MMKKLCSIFGFAALLLISYAFTSSETAIEETSEVCTEIATETFTESVITLGTGRFYSCFIAPMPPTPGSIVYRLSNATGGYQDVVGCDSDIITLPAGTYDLYILSTSVQAYVYCQWEFCNGIPGGFGDADGNVGPSPNPLLIGQVVIPC